MKCPLFQYIIFHTHLIEISFLDKRYLNTIIIYIIIKIYLKQKLGLTAIILIREIAMNKSKNVSHNLTLYFVWYEYHILCANIKQTSAKCNSDSDLCHTSFT